ncbi:MAG: 7-cyano-7-deazaguanine synthase QueC [Deltaproteobacteria bacterium]|nr:MAG: 7-cyano-7-deazaguanine synthase QueC [Deltaproteobacteria bacterium]
MSDDLRAVVLLSGGLDSATTLAIARSEGRKVWAMSFAYGQRHAAELACARFQARAQGVVSHQVIDLSDFGRIVADATALVTHSPHDVPDRATGSEDEIPITYVPARNTVFLSYGLALAEAVDATEIWIGANAVDYSGYPDCRPDFLEAFERVANLGTRAGREHPEGAAIRIRAPLVERTKAEIVRTAMELGVDLGRTVSCYAPRGTPSAPLACGTCPSCRIRLAGFAAAGYQDPAAYVATAPSS